MDEKSNYRILEIRNEISFYIDDLAALVANSTLAEGLRSFSEEIMEMSPGFALSLKQVKDLKDLTQRILKQYASHSIGDDAIMDYHYKARIILKGNNNLNGGSKMKGIRLFHGKEIRQQESLAALERQYEEICNQIVSSEEDMARAIRSTKGADPNSQTYRNNERIYNHARDQLKLYNQQETMLRKALDEAGRVKLIEEFKKQQEQIAKNANIVLGNEKELNQILAGAELAVEATSSTLRKAEGFGDSLLSTEADVPSTVSDFGARVAENERRETILENAGLSPEEVEKVMGPITNAFASAVKAAEERDEKL